MPNPYVVKISIKAVKGECIAGHKVGDNWLIEGGKTVGGICMGAWTAIYPYVRALADGAEFHWAKDKDVVSLACPDAQNPVVFELRRLR